MEQNVTGPVALSVRFAALLVVLFAALVLLAMTAAGSDRPAGASVQVSASGEQADCCRTPTDP